MTETHILRDQVAIVVGGASGIGRALCEALAKIGAHVLVADIDGRAAAATAADLCKGGADAWAVCVDVTQPDSVQALVSECHLRKGRIDFLFSCAGLPVIGDMSDVPLEKWQAVIDTNMWGVVHGMRTVLPYMLRQRSGHIVNVASSAGLMPTPTAVAYVASKAAVVGASEALRIECADTGVRVSVACPGLVQTPFLGQDVDVFRGLVRIITPEECAREILKGVVRNRAVIAFPRYVRLQLWLHRLAPSLAFRMSVSLSRKLRKFRLEHGST